MIIFDNVLPVESNLKILDLIAKQEWFISRDDMTMSQFETIIAHNTGLQNITYQEGKDGSDYQDINNHAQLILDKVSDKLNIKTKPHRFFWNLYFTPSFAKPHRDWPVPNEYQTIVYNLHTTDGGTEIEGKNYKDKMGQAKVFESNLLHKGISCKKDKVRFNLNIIFKKI